MINKFWYKHKAKLPVVASIITAAAAITSVLVIRNDLQAQIDQLEFDSEVKDLQIDWLKDQIDDLEQDVILLRN